MAVALLRSRGLRMDWRTVDYIADATFHRLPSVLLLGLALQLVACLVLWRSPLAWLRGFATPGSLLTFARVWLGLMVMTYTYLWLKISVPLVNRALWDAELWTLDRWLHLGVSPSLLAVELVAGTRLVPWIDFWYSLWLTTIFATQAYLFFDPDRRKRLNFAFACALLWLAAAWIYVALPAVGPCFFVREVFDPVREAMPGAAALQEKLWQNYLQMIAGRDGGQLIQFKPFFAVAALPSVHVGAHFMFTLWARRHARRLWPLFAAATALTFVGSLVTGWHYAVDGYLGMLLGWCAVRLADRWAPVEPDPAPAPDAAAGGWASRSAPLASRGVVALLLIAFVASGLWRWRANNPFDYYQFWLVGQATSSMEVANIYGEADRAAVNAEFRRRAELSGSPSRIAASQTWDELEPTATPFLYAIVHLASTGDFDVDYGRFRTVSLLAFVLSIVWLAWRLRYPPWAVLLAVVGFTQLFWPFYTDTLFANVGQLQVGLLAVLFGLLLRGGAAGEVAAGATLGFLAVFKPTVSYAGALLALLWIARGQLRRLSRFACGAVAMAAIGAVLPTVALGPGCSWSGWRRDFPRLMFTERYLGGGFLGKLIGLRDLAAFAAFGLLLLALVAGVVWAVERRAAGRGPSPSGEAHDEIVMVALGLAIYLLSGPIVHSHYFLLGVPATLLALAPGSSGGRHALAALGFLLTAAHPWIRRVGLTEAPNHSLWSFLGLWILAGVVLSDYARRRLRALPTPESVGSNGSFRRPAEGAPEASA